MSYRLIKFFNPEAINEETGEKGVWQSVAVCEDKGEKGDKGDPFTYEDFKPEQLEELKGYVYLPEVDEEGNLSWTNDGNLENPETVNIKGEKGDTGERGYHFTPSIDDKGNVSWTNNGGLENPETVNVRGYHFTPSIDENCNLSWTNNGNLENPEEVTLRGVVQSNEEPDNHSVLWVVEEEDSGNVGKDIVTSNSVNRIEIVEGDYPETLEENVLYIKVK